MSTQDDVRNVIIIGSGPAGLTAGIYAARANLHPLCIEGFNAGGLIPGGQLMFTSEVENYPGFPEKITGQELMQRFRDQATHQGCDILTGDVTRVDLSKRPFEVWAMDTDGKEQFFKAKTIIAATGARANYIGLDSEEKLKNKGVSACAVCDGAFFRKQHVAVVGGGDTAMEEAHYLTGLCASVTLIHRRDEFRASKSMQDRVLKNPKIKVLYSHAVDEVLGVAEDHVTGLMVKSLKTGEKQKIDVTGLFVAIGHTPLVDVFKGQVELRDNGYIKTIPGTTQTNVPAFFAAGDVQDHVFRQAVTAAGTGCMAALEAERWLGANDAH
ncbi:MAG: thioredoxin-disulfide reductase [Polyangiaceae bacterium]